VRLRQLDQLQPRRLRTPESAYRIEPGAFEAGPDKEP